MREQMINALVDLKARQLNGERMPCPRCGKDTMNLNPFRNALSRHADIHICDECGTSEAMLDFMQNPLPIDQWACFLPKRPPSDFNERAGVEVWEQIREEQLPRLVKLYERWMAAPAPKDFSGYRAEAYENCAGLTHLWREPFQAAYDVRDGRLLIRFRSTQNGTEVAHDLVGK